MYRLFCCGNESKKYLFYRRTNVFPLCLLVTHLHLGRWAVYRRLGATAKNYRLQLGIIHASNEIFIILMLIFVNVDD